MIDVHDGARAAGQLNLERGWLRQQLRKARHDAIAAYAAEMAGSSFDLDRDLESAGIEYLVKTGKEMK